MSMPVRMPRMVTLLTTRSNPSPSNINACIDVPVRISSTPEHKALYLQTG